MIKKVLILIACVILGLNSIFAQVVNIEKKRKGDKDGFSGVVGFGFNLVDNGKSITKFSNIIDLQYKKGANVFILLNDLQLMRVDDNDLINSGFQHIRYNYTFKDSSFLTFESFVQHQYNTIKLIERRFLIGSGFRYRIVGSDNLKLYIATLAMYEYEQRSNKARELLEFARLASYFSLSWDISSNLNLNSINYYQPVFTGFDNYRISSETSLNIKLNNLLYIKIACQIVHNSKPSEGVQQTFYSWENSLKLKF